MELTEKELKELEKIPSELRARIIAMFANPYYSAFKALSSQLTAFSDELISDPFTIRGDEDFTKHESSENFDRIVTALTTSARAKAETALKISKEIKSLSEDVEVLRLKLTPDELEKATSITTTADIRKQALNGK
jgi:hypothetical protein